jgi:hypothetical protein
MGETVDQACKILRLPLFCWKNSEVFSMTGSFEINRAPAK